jgi:hypothetical protein
MKQRAWAAIRTPAAIITLKSKAIAIFRFRFVGECLNNRPDEEDQDKEFVAKKIKGDYQAIGRLIFSEPQRRRHATFCPNVVRFPRAVAKEEERVDNV